MLNSDHLHVVIGLGKTGCSCLQYLLSKNIPVAVTDSRFASGFDEALIRKADVIVLSPGISKKEPIIAEQLSRGVPVIGDIELFAEAVDAPVIAITGSNGKSTVTTLLGEMAKQAGLDVRVGGNLGTPVLDLLTEPGGDLFILELSSFQLETTESLKPLAATILNISADHMDRYDSIQEYIAAKHRIYTHANVAILNADDANTFPLNHQKIISFGLGNADFRVFENHLMHGNEKIISTNELALKGKHNWQNALAALALGSVANIPLDSMLQVLKTFAGIPHRCQWVAKFDDIDWVNDSKATNVGAAKAAIEGLGEVTSGKLVLIAGGQAKDKNFDFLQQPVKENVRTAILIGQDAASLMESLSPYTNCLLADDINHAVSLAKKEAKPGDAVLLSPACASFDMFKNFEHRGQAFIKAVLESNHAHHDKSQQL